MKKIYNLLMVAFCIGITSWATAQVKVLKVQDLQSAPYRMKAMKGDEPQKGEFKDNVNLRYPDKIIGFSLYDLQTNATVQRRVAVDGKGNVAATWTMSLDDISAGFPDRGAGYNYFDGSDWGDEPEERVEDVRCGWPSITIDGSGTTAIVSHVNGDNLPYVSRKVAGSDTWDYSTIPSTAGNGTLWPRSAVGGPNNEYLHVISITVPEGGNGGLIHEGVNGHIIYHRSPDGGETWDQVDVIIPGLDSAFYNNMGVDAYSIDARGSTVAVAVFGQWNDLALFKSTDNGETWTKTLVLDFPLDKYVPGTPYDTTDIGGVDTTGPGGSANADETALRSIYTTDGAGALAIDPDGKCHILYGEMFVSDSDFDQPGSNFYPGINGIAYWNEDMDPGVRPQAITGALDLDGDGILFGDGAGALATYFKGLATYPTLTIDDNGKMFFAYSAVTETFISATQDEYYRHIYIMSSDDGGETWSDPLDVINEDFYKGTDDEGLEEEVEAVFPGIATDANYVYLVFQKDFEPGMNVQAPQGQEDDILEQEISFLKFDKNLNLVERVVKPSTLGMSLTPNPAQTFASVNFELKSAAEVRVELYDMQGSLMNTQSLGKLASGTYQQSLNMDLTSGMYIVKLVVNKSASSMRLVVD